MITETYQFICKHCDKGYRGLVKTCPNCGAELLKQYDKEYTKQSEYYSVRIHPNYPKDK